MICKFSVENYKTFAEKVELDFCANMNIKRMGYNYINVGGKNIFKCAGFYGPNNTGKTCILEAINDLKAIMLNGVCINLSNVFAKKGSITSFFVEYIVNGHFYTYSVKYDNNSHVYVSESLVLESDKDAVKIFSRTENKLASQTLSQELKGANFAHLFSKTLPFMLVADFRDSESFAQAKKDYLEFANSLVLLKMDRAINIAPTIDLLQKDQKAARFIKEFVKNCDLHIDDFGLTDNPIIDVNIESQLNAALNGSNFPKEYLKIISKHNGYRVPAVLFDSVGTLKLIALSGFIYDALHNGKTLLIDEIDSSLHHILTKSIVAMFLNVLNSKAQLLFTTHDALLMDLKSLFRKDQVFLVDLSKERNTSEVIRLSDNYTSRSENGIRGDEDITSYYLKGRFGGIPTPDLFIALEEVVEDEW